jgi:hypothetical protein
MALRITLDPGLRCLDTVRNCLCADAREKLEAIIDTLHEPVMGNHPGRSGIEGFVIQQEYKNLNEYRFSHSNGNEV